MTDAEVFDFIGVEVYERSRMHFTKSKMSIVYDSPLQNDRHWVSAWVIDVIRDGCIETQPFSHREAIVRNTTPDYGDLTGQNATVR